MQIQVKTDNQTNGSTELTRQVKAVLKNALSHFGNRTPRMEVYFSDENSSHKFGAKDKRCVIEARLAGLTPITVSHRGTSLQQALGGAANTLEKTLKRVVGRKDSLFKRRARSTSFEPLLQHDAVAEDGCVLDDAGFVAR